VKKINSIFEIIQNSAFVKKNLFTKKKEEMFKEYFKGIFKENIGDYVQKLNLLNPSFFSLTV
jgi:hypothetical protein